MYVLFFLISFGASIIGAICGIGGGVIIKPVLDASGTLLPGARHDVLLGPPQPPFGGDLYRR